MLNPELLTSLLFVFPRTIYSFRKEDDSMSWLQAVSEAVIRCMFANFQVSGNSIIMDQASDKQTYNSRVPPLMSDRTRHARIQKYRCFLCIFLLALCLIYWVRRYRASQFRSFLWHSAFNSRILSILLAWSEFSSTRSSSASQNAGF